MGRYVFNFGRDGADGDPQDKRRLGGKGAGLAAMTQLGVPVPPGFTISTEACADRQHSDFNELGLNDEIDLALRRLEREMGLGFGDANDPLLVSVRSGAEVSMPGMMDTILNLGLTRAGVDGLARKSENPRFAWDSYRRLIQMYGSVVLGVPFERFEEALERAKEAAGAKADTDLDAAALEQLVGTYGGIVQEVTGRAFPDDSREQLVGAIEAVFNSWNNPRAITYRRAHGIAGLLGTAVNVQAMVFGNMGDDCATGVCFTRDPSTGENVFFGEYLRNAQGEDVVAGIRTPRPIAELEGELPEAYGQLMGAKRTLEGHYRDLLDLEFTIQNNRLFMLQTRAGKRSGLAAFRIAAEMVASGDLDARTGVTRVHPEHVEHLLFPVFDVDAKRSAVNDGARLATGLGAGPGAASGKLAFTAEAAEQLAASGTPCILVRRETSPEDIGGMMAADGILTTTGGRTSHAAVVARGIGKCCVVGCGAASVDAKGQILRVGDKTYGPNDILSIDGFTGEVFEGALPKRESDLLRSLEAGGQVDLNTTGGHFRIVLGWADAVRRLRVRANADTPHDAQIARRFGAEGIGLCRTEHMFFNPEERINAMRKMILARDVEGRRAALETLLPMQREDFVGIFQAMDGFPVTIRLLDPPLHEFLPADTPTKQKLADELGIELDALQRLVDMLHEQNPMLGHRGCRLSITYPEIYEMQARAILEAATQVQRGGGNARPEIMIPLVGHVAELRILREKVLAVARQVRDETESHVPFTVGTMIEVPRAALTAGDIATEADFFSFGTNDLTQMTLGISRDDSGKFLPSYQESGILQFDPFRKLDQEGVGRLVKVAVKEGRETKPGLKVGICGEHGGEPSSIAFCHANGLDYVSCSPFRVPVARLAAARAAIEAEAAAFGR